jgi:hypothetical protein
MPMRCDERLDNSNREAKSYTFHFQMTNGGGRQACSVRVRASDLDSARLFFRDNWRLIEPLARERLAGRANEDLSSQLCLDAVDAANMQFPPRDAYPG